MTPLDNLISAVEASRARLIFTVSGLSFNQATFKPDPESWSLRDITEHMVWAEQIGVMGMWKAADGIRNGQPIWEGKNPNAGLSIETVIEQTWQTKEKVPEVAKPKWGGPIAFWISALEACTHNLSNLKDFLNGLDPEKIIYPHPISGPLNVVQRINFLRFHLDRHQAQMERIKQHPNFPQ